MDGWGGVSCVLGKLLPGAWKGGKTFWYGRKERSGECPRGQKTGKNGGLVVFKLLVEEEAPKELRKASNEEC